MVTLKTMNTDILKNNLHLISGNIMKLDLQTDLYKIGTITISIIQAF